MAKNTNYTYQIRWSNGIINLPKDIGVKCKEIGISGDEIKKYYDRYQEFGIPRVTYAIAALRAIEDKRYNEMKKMRGGFL